MILFVAGGFAVQHFLSVANAAVIATVLGLLLAPLVPAKTACGIKSPPPPVDEDVAAPVDETPASR